MTSDSPQRRRLGKRPCGRAGTYGPVDADAVMPKVFLILICADRVPRRHVLAAWITAVLCLSGCNPAPERKVTNPDPSGKVPAIKEAVREHDLRDVGQLVRDLESDDPAVRFYAIQGLYRLTGHTFGYVFYADDLPRQAAVGRWRQWLAQRDQTLRKEAPVRR